MLVCGACAEENPDRARFCLACGTPLPRAGEPAPSRPPAFASREARKIVTVLFCDVVGSTAMAEHLESESVRVMISRFFSAARSVLEGHRGTVEKFVGDAVVAAFGVPLVHEDDAVQAIRAALEIQAAVADLNREFHARWGLQMAVRIGINTGEVVAGDPAPGQSFISGDPVNVAARLEQSAAAGEILIGEDTHRLVRAAARLEPVAPLSAKGKSKPLPAWRLLGMGEEAARPYRADSTLLGRDDELSRLQRAFAVSVDQQRCQVCTVIGSPGIGKSALVETFSRRVAGDASVLGGRCLPYGEGITYWPLAEVIREAAQLDSQDDPAQARSKLAVLVDEGSAGSTVLDAVLGVLGLASAAAQDETFWAVRKLLEAVAAARPLVIVLDDLHWAEPTMLDLVEHLRDWSRSGAILILVVARPELSEVRPSLVRRAAGLDCVRLEPLGVDASRMLAEAVAGEGLDPGLLARVVQTAEGNPLFVCEILRMLVDDGVLATNGRTNLNSAGDFPPVSIPPTIQALLAARLDRLGDGERTVIEGAAVIGKQFLRGPLAELVQTPAGTQLDSYLDRLVAKELVEPDAEAWAGEPAYRFSHLLIRDAAYHRLLKHERARLHECMAGWLERRSASLASADDEDLLGYHLEQAHDYLKELGRLDDHGIAVGSRAAARLLASGRRALARGDHPAAAKLLERAGRCVGQEDPARADILLDLAECLVASGDVSRAGAVIGELGSAAMEHGSVSGRRGDAALAARVTIARCELHALTDPRFLADSAGAAAAAIRTLTGYGDAAGLARAHLVLARTLGLLGRLAEAEQELDHALVQARLAGDAARARQVLLHLPFVVLWGPVPVPRANGRLIDTLRIVRLRPGSRAVESEVLRGMAVLEAMRGRIDAARSLITSSRVILAELGLPVRLYELNISAGIVELMAGEPVGAERDLRIAYRGFLDLKVAVGAMAAAAWLAEALYRQRRWSESATFVGIAEAAGAGASREAAVWQGVRAKLEATAGDLVGAELLARAAVASMHQSDALVDRADALINLAEVLRISAKAAAARDVYREAAALYDAKGSVIGSARAAALAIDPLAT